jgi:hypothetical protein
MQTLYRRSFFNKNLSTVLGYSWKEWTPIELKKWKEVAKLSRYAIEKARFYFNSIGKNGNPTDHYKLNFKKLRQPLKKIFLDNTN